VAVRVDYRMIDVVDLGWSEGREERGRKKRGRSACFVCCAQAVAAKW
jgi:hypothetical protein